MTDTPAAARGELPVFRVHTRVQHRAISGKDSIIAEVPDRLYVTHAGRRVIVVQLLGRVLRRLAEESATSIGEVLHHAEFVITDDAAKVEELGMCGRPYCARCRASVDQALACLAAKKEPLLVGTLYWAEQ